MQLLEPVATAICIARRHFNVVQCLLDHGADPKFQDDNHRMPLNHAAFKLEGHLKIIRVLLEHNADANS